MALAVGKRVQVQGPLTDRATKAIMVGGASRTGQIVTMDPVITVHIDGDANKPGGFVTETTAEKVTEL